MLIGMLKRLFCSLIFLFLVMVVKGVVIILLVPSFIIALLFGSNIGFTILREIEEGLKEGFSRQKRSRS